jgi:hypothetical protein
VCENLKGNRRSLHNAPPDFLLVLVALVKFTRLSLLKAAHAVVFGCPVARNPGTLLVPRHAGAGEMTILFEHGIPRFQGMSAELQIPRLRSG